MTDTSYAKGLRGESAAKAYLLAHGMKIVASRYRCPLGEIDLIAQSDGVLAFVEVKARGTVEDAAYAITPAKRRRMIKTARCFLGQHPAYQNAVIRFDAALVTGDTITYIADAFQGSEWS